MHSLRSANDKICHTDRFCTHQHYAGSSSFDIGSSTFWHRRQHGYVTNSSLTASPTAWLILSSYVCPCCTVLTPQELLVLDYPTGSARAAGCSVVSASTKDCDQRSQLVLMPVMSARIT